MVGDMQTSIDFASQARDKGMKKALDHADRVHDGWSNEAYSLLKRFIFNSRKDSPFTAEDFRRTCIWLPPPPKDQAFGSILIRAAREGLIEKVGYTQAKDPKSHKRPVTLWKKK